MTTHWHVGNNTPGFLPDPESVWVAHTAQDALSCLVDDLKVLAAELADFDEGTEAEEAAATLEEALPHFTEGGQVDVSNVNDSDVERILNSLLSELVVNVGGEVYWVRRCELDCAS